VVGVLIASAAVTALSLAVRAGAELPWFQWMLKGGH
jgi:hypothetical protein